MRNLITPLLVGLVALVAIPVVPASAATVGSDARVTQHT